VTGSRLPRGDAWSGTHVSVPPALASRPFRHVISGEELSVTPEGDRRRLSVADALATVPVALLWSAASAPEDA
jgi:hypothetical protein